MNVFSYFIFVNAINKAVTSKTKDLIVQHNDLIGARQNLTLQEKRIMLWLSSQVRSNDEDFKEHELSIKDFCKIVGVQNEGMYTRLASITKGLMKRVVEVQSINGSDVILEQFALLSYAKYQKSCGTVVLSFHPQMKKFLLNLQKNFTKTSLSVSLSFSSLYSLRVYELFKKDTFMQMKSFSVLELRDLLCIKDGKYKQYKDFKKRVIESSINEINEKSDIVVDWVEVKTGRKVTSIRCSINVKEQCCDVLPDLSAFHTFKISDHSLNQMRKEFSDDAVSQGLLSLKTYKGKVKNPVLFLKKAIKEGWQPFDDKNQQEQSKELSDEIHRGIALLDESQLCIQIRKLFLEREGEAEYKSWIQPLSLFVEGESIVVVAKNRFSQDWLEANYAKQFSDYSEGRRVAFRLDDQEVLPAVKKSQVKKNLRQANAVERADVPIVSEEAIGKMIRTISASKKKKTAHQKQEIKQEPPAVEVVKKKSLWERITSFWK